METLSWKPKYVSYEERKKKNRSYYILGGVIGITLLLYRLCVTSAAHTGNPNGINLTVPAVILILISIIGYSLTIAFAKKYLTEVSIRSNNVVLKFNIKDESLPPLTIPLESLTLKLEMSWYVNLLGNQYSYSETNRVLKFIKKLPDNFWAINYYFPFQ